MTSKNKQLKLPKMEAVERIINIPLVESSWKYAENIYNRIKRSNNLFTWTLDRAEDSLYNVIDSASPAVFLIEKPLSAIDKVLCRSLDIVEQRVPSINLPPQMIYYNTREYVVRPVLKRADSMKQIGNSVLASKYTTYAADKLDGALNVADKYIDKYLPDDAVEGQGTDETDANSDPNDSQNKAMQTIQHMDRFSRKLQRRLTKLTLAEAKVLKEHSAEAIHVLAYVGELILTDPKLALQKGKELWLTLSGDEPENQARPENLEELFVLLTRESARRIVHFVNFTTSSMGKLPRSVAAYVRQTTDQFLQTIRSILKEHLTSILAEIQQSSQQDQSQQQSNKQSSIPQTTITNSSNQTYPVRQQQYDKLQPPSSPNSQLKATHNRHIVNGVENATS